MFMDFTVAQAQSVLEQGLRLHPCALSQAAARDSESAHDHPRPSHW